MSPHLNTVVSFLLAFTFVIQRTLLARDSIYAIARYMPSPVRSSVRLSVRHTGGSVKDVLS